MFARLPAGWLVRVEAPTDTQRRGGVGVLSAPPPSHTAAWVTTYVRALQWCCPSAATQIPLTCGRRWVRASGHYSAAPCLSVLRLTSCTLPSLLPLSPATRLTADVRWIRGRSPDIPLPRPSTGTGMQPLTCNTKLRAPRVSPLPVPRGSLVRKLACCSFSPRASNEGAFVILADVRLHLRDSSTNALPAAERGFL